ncbi:MAG: LysR family transcriptional regulator [Synechococcus sp.]
MDKFEQIRAFAQVVEAGGFAAAARQIGVSRSAVNKLVSGLEQDLSVQLFHRSTRVVSPTETGLAFYNRCVDILGEWEEAQRSVMQLHAEPKGRLRMNAPMTFGTMYMAGAIAEFAAHFPDLQVQLTLNDRFVDPIEEGFDITVRISEPQPISSLFVQPLVSAERVLCASPDYLAKRGTPTFPAELRSHSCLHYYGHIAAEKRWTLLGKDGAEHTVKIDGAMCSNNGEVLREAAIQGLGITLLPRFIVANGLKAGTLAIVMPDYHPSHLSIEVLYPVNRHLSTKIRLLVDFLRKKFGPGSNLFD